MTSVAIAIAATAFGAQRYTAGTLSAVLLLMAAPGKLRDAIVQAKQNINALCKGPCHLVR